MSVYEFAMLVTFVGLLVGYYQQAGANSDSGELALWVIVCVPASVLWPITWIGTVLWIAVEKKKKRTRL